MRERRIDKDEWQKCIGDNSQACTSVSGCIDLGENIIWLMYEVHGMSSSLRNKLEIDIQDMNDWRTHCPAWQQLDRNRRKELPCMVAARSFQGVLQGEVYANRVGGGE